MSDYTHDEWFEYEDDDFSDSVSTYDFDMSGPAEPPRRLVGAHAPPRIRRQHHQNPKFAPGCGPPVQRNPPCPQPRLGPRIGVCMHATAPAAGTFHWPVDVIVNGELTPNTCDPVLGDMLFVTSTHQLFVHDGMQWQSVKQ